jgi:hypothetical protein
MLHADTTILEMHHHEAYSAEEAEGDFKHQLFDLHVIGRLTHVGANGIRDLGSEPTSEGTSLNKALSHASMSEINRVKPRVMPSQTKLVGLSHRLRSPSSPPGIQAFCFRMRRGPTITCFRRSNL